MTGAPQTYQRIHSCVAMEPPPKDCEAGVTLLKITTAQRSSGIELGINSTPIHFNMGRNCDSRRQEGSSKPSITNTTVLSILV